MGPKLRRPVLQRPGTVSHPLWPTRTSTRWRARRSPLPRWSTARTLRLLFEISMVLQCPARNLRVLAWTSLAHKTLPPKLHQRQHRATVSLSCPGRGRTRSARHRRLRHHPQGCGKSCQPNLRTQCLKPVLRRLASHNHCQQTANAAAASAPGDVTPALGAAALRGITATVGAASPEAIHRAVTGRATIVAVAAVAPDADAFSCAQASPAASWVVRRAARSGRRFVAFARRCCDVRPVDHRD